jgi:hypothetical protein
MTGLWVTQEIYTGIPRFVFVGDPEKEGWIWENYRYRDYSLNIICSKATEIQLGIRKMIHLGMIDQGFTA